MFTATQTADDTKAYTIYKTRDMYVTLVFYAGLHIYKYMLNYNFFYMLVLMKAASVV